MKKFMIYWLPAFVWMGFLFPLTNNSLSLDSTSRIIVPIIKWLLPNASQDTINTLHFLIRKLIHFSEYALLAILAFWGFRGMNRKKWNKKWIIYAGIIAISYGFLDELLQILISSRTGAISDWFINVAGVVFALTIVSLRQRYWESKNRTLRLGD